MLFLKSTSVTKAPGIYEVDVAAKPPGKTFGVFMATDPDNPPQSILAGLAELGFRNIHEQRFVHKDWKSEECTANLAALDALFGNVGITLAPRVMSLAEAYR